MKRTVILFLSIVSMLISTVSISVIGYAEGVTEPVNEDFIDEYIEPDHTQAFYFYLNNSQHQVKWYWWYVYTDTRVKFLTDVLEREYPENHTVSSYSYTGNNYHSGTKHYFEYAGYCEKCSGRVTKWVSGNCLGNGHIEPFSGGSVSK